MTYMQVDHWIELEEARQARLRRLQQPRLRRRQRDAQVVLGFPVPIERPEVPLVAEIGDLLRRIDQEVTRIRRQHERPHAGRRAALLEREDLAREAYQVAGQHGIEPTIRALDMSRQAIADVWHRHGWPPPIGASNRVKKTP